MRCCSLLFAFRSPPCLQSHIDASMLLCHTALIPLSFLTLLPPDTLNTFLSPIPSLCLIPHMLLHHLFSSLYLK